MGPGAMLFNVCKVSAFIKGDALSLLLCSDTKNSSTALLRFTKIEISLRV